MQNLRIYKFTNLIIGAMHQSSVCFERVFGHKLFQVFTSKLAPAEWYNRVHVSMALQNWSVLIANSSCRKVLAAWNPTTESDNSSQWFRIFESRVQGKGSSLGKSTQ